jgi:hypothetical protein
VATTADEVEVTLGAYLDDPLDVSDEGVARAAGAYVITDGARYTSEWAARQRFRQWYSEDGAAHAMRHATSSDRQSTPVYPRQRAATGLRRQDGGGPTTPRRVSKPVNGPLGKLRPTRTSRISVAIQGGGRLSRDRVRQRNVRDAEDGPQVEGNPLVAHRRAVWEGHVWAGHPEMGTLRRF